MTQGLGLTNKKLILIAQVVVLVLAMSACNKKNESAPSASRVARGANVAPTPGPNQTFQPGGQNSVFLSSTGRIFVDPQFADQFTAAMKALVSATMDPEYLGRVATDQVFLRGYVEVDSSGNVVASSSRVEIEIRDEWTGQRDELGLIPPVVIRLQAIRGRAFNGEAQIVFGDNYGSMEFSGRFENPSQTSLNSALFRGEFKFQNNNGRAGSNLRFEIATCGFFRC